MRRPLIVIEAQVCWEAANAPAPHNLFVKEEIVNLKEKVEQALNSVRPHLQADGGNVELVEVSEDGIAKVRLVGACGGCPMAAMTLQHGVTKAIMDAVPEIKNVQAV
jgi:Fe-S cluster biogenesis protein NfuA